MKVEGYIERRYYKTLDEPLLDNKRTWMLKARTDEFWATIATNVESDSVDQAKAAVEKFATDHNMTIEWRD